MTNSPPGLPIAQSLALRELSRFSRQPARIVAAVATPLLIWGVLAAGVGGAASGSGPGVSYGAYVIPGIAAMSVTFSAIFAAMSLIEDRASGFLQGVLISPAPRWAVIAGKIAGGSLIALAQGLLILALGPALDVPGLTVNVQGLGLAALALLSMSVGVTALGLALAWVVNSSAGFHGVMNLVLMPMLLLSGAFFPVASSSRWIAFISDANPLGWAVRSMHSALGVMPTDLWAWAGAAAFPAAACTLAGVVMRRRSAPSPKPEPAQPSPA
jgi:ABC-2 type transport system permease protein